MSFFQTGLCPLEGGWQPQAVGGSKSEGATPLRMECIAIKKSKIYIEKNQTKFDETLKRYILPLAKSELWRYNKKYVICMITRTGEIRR